MSTRVFGASDDLVEFDGDLTEEFNCSNTEERGTGVLVMMSDGTALEVKYGKGDQAIWGVTLLKRGELFDRIDQCDDPDAKVYSDVAIFRDGITGAFACAAGEWERLK